MNTPVKKLINLSNYKSQNKKTNHRNNKIESYLFKYDKQQLNQEMCKIIDYISNLKNKIDDYETHYFKIITENENSEDLSKEKENFFAGYNIFKKNKILKLSQLLKSLNENQEEIDLIENINKLHSSVISNRDEFSNIVSDDNSRNNLFKIKEDPMSKNQYLNKKRNSSNIHYGDCEVLSIKSDKETAIDSFNFIFFYYNRIMDRPAELVIPKEKYENCDFCGESSQDISKLKILGPLYGPVIDGNKKYNVHERCALFTTSIYADQSNGKLQNVSKEVELAKKRKCSICKKAGAGIECKDNKCKEVYHFLCAYKEDYILDVEKYVSYCTKHIGRRTYNVDHDFKNCSGCYSKMDPDLMIKCKTCRKNYHVYCVEPKIPEISNEWQCCLNTSGI
jgi:hypothetical protein